MTTSQARLKYNIKRLAAARNKTLPQVAEDLNLSVSTLYYQLDRSHGFRYELVDNLAEYFKVDTAELFKENEHTLN